MHDHKAIGDTVSGLMVAGALAKILPPIAALFAIVWYCIQIYDRFWGRKK